MQTHLQHLAFAGSIFGCIYILVSLSIIERSFILDAYL